MTEDQVEASRKESNDKKYYRKTARIVGALFIIATLTAVLSMPLIGSTLDGPDYLTEVSDNKTEMITVVVLWIILAVSVIGIGIVFYPVLKRINEAIAQAYIGLRLMEGICIVFASICIMSVVSLSQDYTAGDAYQVTSNTLILMHEWSFAVGTLIFLGLGGLSLYYLVYRSKLVPSWLSIWGLIGAASVLVYGLVTLFGYDPAILAAPIAVQEMVFAGWLIIRGFDAPAEP